MRNRKFLYGFFLGILCTVLFFTIGLNTNHSYKKIRVIDNLIKELYIEEIDSEILREGIFAGLIQSLNDPYGEYYTEEEYQDILSTTEGLYVGIGVLMQENPDGGATILECYEGAPGEQAGLKAGDVICKVNETDVTDRKVSEIAELIKNCGKNSVWLTVSRAEEVELIEIQVFLSDVEIPTVFGEMLEDYVGYIRISRFTGVTYEQYVKEFQALKDQGMKKIIVDLRNNPGGQLNSVCDILREILPKGLIVYTEGKDGTREEYTCEGLNPLNMPLVVLVNGESASASEIFAGAVKDYEIGTIMGTTTYGKGIVQSIIPLYDGSAVRMTTAKYYTPKGNNIHGVGVEPDIEVTLADHLLSKDNISLEDDNQLQEAIKYLKNNG